MRKAFNQKINQASIAPPLPNDAHDPQPRNEDCGDQRPESNAKEGMHGTL